jgi:general stress protein YciG
MAGGKPAAAQAFIRGGRHGSPIKKRQGKESRSSTMPSSQSPKQDTKHGSSHPTAEGKKGVSPETVGSGKAHDPNNFANNPARAAEAGRKGGQNSHKND